MTFLNRLFGRQDFPLREFQPRPLEFDWAADKNDHFAFEDIVAEITAAEPGRAPGLQAMPTAGELRASIERHLNAKLETGRQSDASAELRCAFADLRRSLG